MTLLLALLLAVDALPPLVGVNDLVRNSERYDGQIVRVRGWVENCRPQDCSIGENKQYFRRLRRPDRDFVRQVRAHEIGLLSFAEDAQFDAQIAPLLKRPVVATSRFSARCFSKTVFCVDRAPELTPIITSPPHAIEDR